MIERVPPLPPDKRDERQAALVARAGAELSVYTTLVRNSDVFAHHDVIGRAAGLTDEDLAAVVADSHDPLLRAADELVADHRCPTRRGATWPLGTRPSR